MPWVYQEVPKAACQPATDGTAVGRRRRRTSRQNEAVALEPVNEDVKPSPQGARPAAIVMRSRHDPLHGSRQDHRNGAALAPISRMRTGILTRRMSVLREDDASLFQRCVRHRTGPAHESRPGVCSAQGACRRRCADQQIRQALENGQPRLLELTCEKVEGKKVTLLVSEVLAVQLYEKASATGGSKSPGFSFDS